MRGEESRISNAGTAGAEGAVPCESSVDGNNTETDGRQAGTHCVSSAKLYTMNDQR